MNVDRRILTTLTALGALLIVLSLVAIPFKGSDAGGAAPEGAGEQPAGGGGEGGAAVSKVDIKGFKFGPATATVKAGSQVTFTNSDSAPHTATDTESNAFDTGTLNNGQSKAVTVDKPGTVSYACELHPFMKGTLTVE